MKNRKILSRFLVSTLIVGIFGLVVVTNVLGASDPETQTVISNMVPAWDTHTAESWTQAYISGDASTDARNSSSTTYPTNIGTDVVFTATADDPNGDEYYLIVCTTDAVTEGAGSPWIPTCDVTTVCTSSSTTDETAATCSKTTTGAAETVDWYSFVCDNNSDTICSTKSNTSQGQAVDETNGTPTLHGSPYHQNHRPTWATKTITDSGGGTIAPGDTVKFETGTVTDGDDNTSSDTVSLYICSGESDQGGVSGGFNDQTLACMSGGTTLCSLTAQADGTTLTCDDGVNAIVSIPTAHATDYGVEFYVIDSHGFMATTTAAQDFTVIDVAPVFGSYNTDDVFVFSVGASNEVTRAVTFTDDNGDGDPTLIDVVFFEDTEESDACGADEQNCYRFDNEALPGAANCTISDRSGAGSGKTATGTDNSLSVSCDFTVEFNASCGKVPAGAECDADGTATENWEMSATATDGLGDANFTDSNVNSVIPASNGIGIAEATIDYSTVALDTDSNSDITTMQNLGNQILDVLLSGTNMIISGYGGSSCASDTDCIIAAQQKFDESNNVNFDWSTVGDVLITAAPGAGDEAQGCLNRDMAVRAVAATGTEDEVISWVIHIPAVQQSGSYTGTNTFAASAKAANICTGTLY